MVLLSFACFSHRRLLVYWCDILRSRNISTINISDQWKSLFIGAGIQFGLLFFFILNPVVLGGSIGAGIALRGIRDILEQKYYPYSIDLVCDFGYCSRSRYFVRSIELDFYSLYLYFSLNTGQLSYIRLHLLLAIVYCNSIVNIKNDAGCELKHA